MAEAEEAFGLGLGLGEDFDVLADIFAGPAGPAEAPPELPDAHMGADFDVAAGILAAVQQPPPQRAGFTQRSRALMSYARKSKEVGSLRRQVSDLKQKHKETMERFSACCVFGRHSLPVLRVMQRCSACLACHGTVFCVSCVSCVSWNGALRVMEPCSACLACHGTVLCVSCVSCVSWQTHEESMERCSACLACALRVLCILRVLRVWPPWLCAFEL